MFKFQHYNTILNAMNIINYHMLNMGKNNLEKCVAKANNVCDKVVMSLFKLYYNEKVCKNMMFAISTILQRQILDII